MTKDLTYYRRLPYTRRVEVRQDDSTTYFLARIAEIPFIRIHGASQEDALAALQEVFDDCIQAMIDSGDEIPEPRPWPGYAIDEQQPLPLTSRPSSVLQSQEWTLARLGGAGDGWESDPERRPALAGA